MAVSDFFITPSKNPRQHALHPKDALNTRHVNTPINVEATVTNVSKCDNVTHDKNARHLKYAIEFFNGPVLVGAWAYETAADRDADYDTYFAPPSAP